uniref:Salivary lipocalin n=1 Tax=Strongyloides venezuelensis TaxID=75913 RepID=A0A0K0FRH3_STRVS
MKYLITSIVIAIITDAIFIEEDTTMPQEITTTRIPSWGDWDGTGSYSAQDIVKNATELYYNNTCIYYNMTSITLNQTRIVNGTHRYRVKYNATKCILNNGKESEKLETSNGNCDKEKIPECTETEENETRFQAVFRNNTYQHQLGLYVTNMETNTTYKGVYKQPLKKVKKLKKKKQVVN